MKASQIFYYIRFLKIFIIIFIIFAFQPTFGAVQNNAVVLVNSTSEYFSDFGRFILPYLKHFGIPYVTHDIAGETVSAETVNRGLIIVGHKGLDEGGTYLDSTEQNLISSAVFYGAGLVNFDTLLTNSGLTPRYSYIQDILNIGYHENVQAASAEIFDSSESDFIISCWDDLHQDPVLATFSDPGLINDQDGQWDELDYQNRPYPTILAGHGEWETYGLQPMHFFVDGVPSGTYEVWANLYTGSHTRYFYGFREAEVTAGIRWADNVEGAGGADEHEEYLLGTVTITDGRFDLWAGNGDPLDEQNFLYGWAWIRLVNLQAPPSQLHFIAERHDIGDVITLKAPMTILGMIPPMDAKIVATAGSYPFLVVRKYGQGRAVQWGSYEFIDIDVLGQLRGMDDLVWRSLVWAARKPFTMQGMPPLLTFRVDDVLGPLWWAEDAAVFGLKPWMSIFLNEISDTRTAQLKALIDNGNASASVHAFTNEYFFYYEHGVGDYTDAQIADHFQQATLWHQDNGIPFSNFVVGHFYELGTNVFDGLESWGVEFIATHMVPGNEYLGSDWLEMGPYREQATGSSDSSDPVYYADYLTIPGHPEHDNKFFNIVGEIRDNTGYEWYPDNDVNGTVEHGVTQLKRAFDSMVLATLFTHEEFILSISRSNWNVILDRVLQGVASYDPVYVTMDDAVRYVRATFTSDIENSTFDPISNTVTTTLSGETDVPTELYLFTENGEEIVEQRFTVPVFSGSIQVITQLSTENLVDHLGLDTIGDQVAGFPFTITIRALDAGGIPVTSYEGSASLSDTTGTLTPTDTSNFINGTWTGAVTIDQEATGVVITAQDAAVTGTSNTFSVQLPANQQPDGVIDSPTADLTITVGDALDFSGSGTDPDGDLPLSFLWQFGTGSGIPESDLEDPGLLYFNTQGTFTVTFTVTDALGLSDATPATRVITVAEASSVIPKTGWSLWYVDSEDPTGDDGTGTPGTNAFDGDVNTFWHTQWHGGSPATPHEIQIDLGFLYEINGFHYLPIQDQEDGRISQYEFYVSIDGSDWGDPVATGNFANDATEKEVLFAPKTGRYIRLRALTEVNDSPWTSAAEINVLGTPALPK